MGWTSSHAVYYKPDGQVDRKAECDAYFEEGLNRGYYKVLKSAMVGTVYYAAVKQLSRYSSKEENKMEKIPEKDQKIFGVVFLTSVNQKDYYNFSYKDIDENMGPAEDLCPTSILNLLSNTDNEYAIEWREKCRKNAEKQATKRKAKRILDELPVSSQITFVSEKNLSNGIKIRHTVYLMKAAYAGKTCWTDGQYRWSTAFIPDNFTIVYKPVKIN